MKCREVPKERDGNPYIGGDAYEQSHLRKVSVMSNFEALTLMLHTGILLLALLAYLNDKK
jgi:hypothetical protein